MRCAFALVECLSLDSAMLRSLIFVAVTMLLLFAIELIYMPIAKSKGWTSQKNMRRDNHPVAVIGGGIIFYVGMVLWSLGMSFVYGDYAPGSYFLIGLTMLAATSFADDILCLSVWIRLLVHFVAIGFMCFSFPVIEMSPWLLVLYVTAAGGFVNGYNFMDGINGMTAGYSVVVLGVLLYINSMAMHFSSGSLIAVALGAAMVFGFFNFRRRALVFAGDVGSISMGYIVTFLMTQYILMSGSCAGLVLVSVYVTDIVMTILRRLLEGDNIFRAHRKHIYERLHFVWRLPQLCISSVYCLMQLGISVIYLCLPDGNVRSAYCLGAYAVLALVYLLMMYLTERKIKREPSLNSAG